MAESQVGKHRTPRLTSRYVSLLHRAFKHIKARLGASHREQLGVQFGALPIHAS